MPTITLVFLLRYKVVILVVKLIEVTKLWKNKSVSIVLCVCLSGTFFNDGFWDEKLPGLKNYENGYENSYKKFWNF